MNAFANRLPTATTTQRGSQPANPVSRDSKMISLPEHAALRLIEIVAADMAIVVVVVVLALTQDDLRS